MGVEDWENKYKRPNKPQLSDFLDDEEDSVIFRMGRPYPEPSHPPIRQNTKPSGFLPLPYPEGYDTIDRRRKKKITDPAAFLSSEADKYRQETFPSDLAVLREKRGELFMRQVAEMQEEEECMMSCLRPYRNGLLYKTRMWAKNELDNTLENYVAYKKEQDARMRARFDFEFDSCQDPHYPQAAEENMDDMGFMGEDIHSDNTRHYKDRYSFSYEGHGESPQGLREKKGGKSKSGGWVSEAMLSPVEEPIDEYVDPMDELQCLVETVSEYLAEKEEEISKYGSLPKSSKSRLSSQGSIRTDSFGEEQNSSSKDPRGESQSHPPSDQGISGVKNAMSSLLSSFTDKVGGPKPPAPSPQAPSTQPSQSGLTKLFSFIPKSNTTAPVAVVSPVESSPEKSFSSLPSQPPHDAKIQSHYQEMKTPSRSQTQTSTKEHGPEFGSKPESAPGSSVLGKLNPLKLFSGDSGSPAENKPASESTYSQEHTQWDGKCALQDKQPMTAEGFRKSEKLRSSSQEKYMGQNQAENFYERQKPPIYKQENVPFAAPEKSTGQTQSANTGFFSPFRKSLSSLITPSAPVPPQGPPPVAVYPVFRTTEEPQPQKPAEDPSLSSKIKIPLASSENVSAQQRPKAEGGMLSGFLKFASSEDVSASTKTQNPQQASSASTTFTQNPAVPQENSEKRWFSSIFTPASAPSGSNPNIISNQQSQGSHVQHPANQRPTTASHGTQYQAPNQPESQSFLTGIFKGSSANDISNQPKPGGLLSGLLKFGSTSDLSASSPQQAPHNNQPPRSNNQSQFPHHPPQQQSSPAPQEGLLSGILKFSSTENIQQNVQPPEAERQRNIPGNFSCQQQTNNETQPQQKGLLSGLLKFGSSESTSSSQVHPHSSVQFNQPGFNQQNTQDPNRGPQLRDRSLSRQVVQQDTSKPGFTRQQTVPLRQPPSQQGGLLYGLFKFSSADSINVQNQPPTTQYHGITPSKSSHVQTTPKNIPVSSQNQPQNSSTQKSTQASGLFGLFKSSSESVAHQQQPDNIQEIQQQIKVPCSQPGHPQTATSGQSGVLSGLFNKLTKPPENIENTPQTSAGQSPQQRAGISAVPMNTPLQKQSHANITQQSSLEHVKREKRTPQTAQQGFLSGFFSKNVAEESCSKQVDMQSQIPEQQMPSSKDFHPGMLKSSTSDFGRESLRRVVPGHSRHALIGAPVSIDTESLDLRTSVTLGRSLQSQATYSSISTGNLSQLYYSGSLPSAHPMAYSTGNIHSLLQSHSTSSVVNMRPYSGGSTPSLYEATGQSLYKGRSSPFQISPSYDENQWIRESALWQQFQNESLNYQLQGEDQRYGQSCEGSSLSPSVLHCSSPNINQPINTTPWQGVCHQEQLEPYQVEGPRNPDPYPKRKLWNSYEDLGNVVYSPNEEGVLNLTTKPSNAKFGKWHSFNDGSTYSLNGVSYHEGYYEETAPSLSYSPNWQYGTNTAEQQQFYTGGVVHQSQFNLNRPVESNYPPSTEMDDFMYLEDTEWYQQWLMLLEQGMWWPAEDGDCGYFVYTDHEYIYALLTDAAGEYVYACAPEGESWGGTQKFDGLPSALLHNEMVLVCGFKIPLYNEDELLWLPGQDNSDSQLLNAPLDLSAAYRKGNQIMNLNLEQFSQMFENSFLSQGQQEMDFTSYRLNKVRMDPRQPSYAYDDIIDLSCRKKDHTGPYWNIHEMKTFLAQKVTVSLNSFPTANSHQQLISNCYQPAQRRRSSTTVTVKHVDDVSEDEWRKRVSPGEEQPNRQVKKISSLISSFVGKTSQVDLTKTSTSSSEQASQSQNILSSGFQSLKSKIIKEESSAVVTQPEIVKQQIQRPAAAQGRILPTIPTTAPVTQTSTESHTALQKPRLSRQSTMVQQAAPPAQSSVPYMSKESVSKPAQPGHLTAKPVDIPVEKLPEQPGFMNFLKSAVGMEETKPDPHNTSQTSPNQQSKTGSTASLPGSITANKEAAGVSNLFGSISNLFSAEPSPPQKQQMKSSVTEGSLTSASRSRSIQRQETMDKSGTPQSAQSQPSNKSTNQVPSTNLSTAPVVNQSTSMPPAGQPKQEASSKPSGGLFGFSIGEMLVGSAAPTQSEPTPQTSASATAPQEESLGKSILSMFSGPSPQQAVPKTGPLPQTNPPNAAPQPPQQETLGKSLLSMFGGSSPAPPPSQTKPTAEAPQHRTIPPKDPPATGILSMFGGPSTQQSQAQTGSFLGGILPGQSNSSESPMKGLFSVFTDPSPPQPQPPTMQSQQRGAQSQTSLQRGPQTPSKPPEQPQPQEPTAASVLGGLFGSLSATNESPRKSLFSMFGGPSTPQTPSAGGYTNMSSTPGTAAPNAPGSSIRSISTDVPSPQQTPSPSSAVVSASKEPQTTHLQESSAEMLSVSSSHVPEAATTNEKSSEPSENKTNSNAGKVQTSLSTDTMVETTTTSQEACTIEGTDMASKVPNSESTVMNKEASTESAPQDSAPLKEPPASGLLSMITGSGAPSAAGLLSDSPGKGLLSLFSAPSTEPTTNQTGPSPTGSVPEPSAPKDPPRKSLFSVFGGSVPQPTSQPGSSLLESVFGGSSPQTPASQPGGLLLGGLFGGSAPQTAPQVGPTKPGGSAPQTSGPQSGPSLLGGLFSGAAPQAAGSQTAGSILGGLFGGSAASSTVPQSSGSFGGLFGGTAPQTSTNQNNSSTLGGILGGSSSQTATAQIGSSLLGGVLPGASSTNEMPSKSLFSMLGGSASAATPTSTSNDDKKTTVTTLTDTTSGVTVLPKPTDDSKPAPAVAQMEVNDAASKCKEVVETPKQPDGSVQCPETSLSKTDSSVPEEVCYQDNDKSTVLTDNIQCKESEIFASAQQPAKPELSGQLSQETTTTTTTQPPKVAEEALPTPSVSPAVQAEQKPPETNKSGSDAAADAVTGFVSSLFKPSTAPTEGSQQKNSLFGLGGAAPQAAPGQPGASLLGGIFGGSSAQTASPQAAGSLLGGLFKGPAPQSGPQTSTPTPGGSILDGMFGGGSAPKPAGPQGAGSLLGGVFGGAGATPQPGGSLLEGMFGGATAGSQAGSSLFGGIGGSLFRGMGQPPKPSDSVPAQPRPAPCTPQSQIKNKKLSQKVPPSGCATNKTNQPASRGNQQGKSGSQTSSSAMTSEGASSTPAADTQKEKSGVGEVIHEKPMLIKGDSESKENDKSALPDTKAFPADPVSNNAEHQEGKQSEPSKLVITAQPQTNKSTSDQTHTFQNLATSDAQKTEAVGSTDDVANPHICISTPEVDPSASLTPKVQERLVETHPSAGPTSGVQLDNQSKKDLLNAKRLVKA